MPQSSNEPLELEGRRRVADQLSNFTETNSSADVAWDSPDPTDHNYLFVPGRVLVAADDVAAFNAVARGRPEIGYPSDDDPVPEDRDLVDGLVSYSLPERAGRTRAEDVMDALVVFDEELEAGVVTPEHYLHLATLGTGRLCPATEPEETGLTDPWPPSNTGLPDGSGVEVIVVDTGWVKTSAGSDLPAYHGHGMFAEAVVHGRAPEAGITPVSFPLFGGQPVTPYQDPPATLVAEGDLVTALMSAAGIAAAAPAGPRIISLQAGCHTRRDRPLKAFEQLWHQHLEGDENTLVVAAAGNDGSPLPFYPAASTWAWGVGSLDHDDAVSSFSNYRSCADVFVLGRNHVNTFPLGTYVCKEAPNKHDQRVFGNGLARWSGTSFAAPLLAGLLAAHLSQQPLHRSPREEARHFIRNNRLWRSEPLYGDHRVLPLASVLSPDHATLPAP
jgi:hypothetical protein